jgi:hypothetical protein
MTHAAPIGACPALKYSMAMCRREGSHAGPRARSPECGCARGSRRSTGQPEAVAAGHCSSQHGAGYAHLLVLHQPRNITRFALRILDFQGSVAFLGPAEIEPGDENAAKYLAAIRQRVPRELLSHPGRHPTSAAGRPNAAARLDAAPQHDSGAKKLAQAAVRGMSGARQQSAADSSQNGAAPAAEPRASPTYSPGEPGSSPAIMAALRQQQQCHKGDQCVISSRCCLQLHGVLLRPAAGGQAETGRTPAWTCSGHWHSSRTTTAGTHQSPAHIGVLSLWPPSVPKLSGAFTASCQGAYGGGRPLAS